MVQSETIGHKHITALIVMFLLGSSLIMGGATSAGKDGWISILLAIASALPIILLYARIASLSKGKNIFEMIEELFGRVAGTALNVIFVIYAFFLASLVTRNFSDFVEISMLQTTPPILVMLLYLFVVAYLLKSGIKTMGKWGFVTLVLLMFIIVLTIILSFGDMDMTHFFPVADKSVQEIVTPAIDMFFFPYAEVVLFLAIIGCLKKGNSPYKTYLTGFLIGGATLLLAFFRNVAVLGEATLMNSYYPSFVTTRITGVREISERIENLVTMNLFFTGLVKVSICMIVAAKGIAHVFRIYDYKKLVMPCALMVLALSPIVSESPITIFSSLPRYKYYALPVEIAIPLLVWLTAEFKNRKGGHEKPEKSSRKKATRWRPIRKKG